MFTMERSGYDMLDTMLESGIDLDLAEHKIRDPSVDKEKVELIKFKHKRWRNLRKFLKLEEKIGTGIT